MEITTRNETLSASIANTIDAVSHEEYQHLGTFGQKMEFLQMERNFLAEEFFDKNRDQTVVDQVLFEAITNSNLDSVESSNNINSNSNNTNSNPNNSRTFRPILRYPPPPINFLLEDELAWCDIDEISLECHNFEYNYNVGDNWNDWLNGKSPSKAGNKLQVQREKRNFMEEPTKEIDMIDDLCDPELDRKLAEIGDSLLKRDLENGMNGMDEDGENIDISIESKYYNNTIAAVIDENNRAIKNGKIRNQTNVEDSTNDGTKILTYTDLVTYISQACDKELNYEIVDNIEKVLEKYNDKEKSLDMQRFGFTPKTLPKFIEKNHRISIALLKNIAYTNERNLKPYLGVFVDKNNATMKKNFRLSLQIIVGLCHTLLIPKTFLHFYISHFIDIIDDLSGEESVAHRDRMGRLFCVFIRSLMSNNVLTQHDEHKDIFIIIEKFAVNNIRLKEASALFKILRGNKTQTGMREEIVDRD